MTDKLNISRHLVEGWLAAFQCGQTTQNKAMDEIESALAEPAVEAAEIEVVDVIGYFNPDNLARVKADEISGFMLHDEESERINTAAMAVAQHRRILAGVNQQSGSGWIACADRLPDSKGFVLARSGQDTDISTGTILAYYSPLDGKFHSTHYATAVYCSHWMPLPPSPAAKAGDL